jgi:gas vesicle protein
LDDLCLDGSNHFKKTNIMSAGKVFVGVLAGAAAGAVLGMLFAPAKGCDLRKKIYKKGEEGTEAVQESFNDFLESISTKFDKLKKDLSRFEDKIKMHPQDGDVE